MSEKHLYVLDLFATAYRGFHACGAMHNSDGQLVNAVFALARDLSAVAYREPTHIVMCEEGSGDRQRCAIYPEYKANRSAMPDDLKPQIEMMRELVVAHGIPIVSHASWEADDSMCSIAKWAESEGAQVTLISADKDLRCCLSPNVRMLSFRKGATPFGLVELRKDWGITPSQCCDLQALAGDSVDNVPGVAGVGPKKAAALLQQFGSLDAILEAAADDELRETIRGKKLRANLLEYADQALMSRELVRLRDDLPIDLTWDACEAHQEDWTAIHAIYQACSFQHLTNMAAGMLSAQTEVPF